MGAKWVKGVILSAGTALAALAVLSGCGIVNPSAAPSSLNEGVYQAEWAPETSNEQQIEIPNTATATILRNNESASLNARFSTDCNTVMATITGNQVTDVMQTMMGCESAPFEQIVIDNLTNGEVSIVDNSHFIVGNLSFTWRVPVGEVIPFESDLLEGEYQGVITQVSADGLAASPLTVAAAFISSGGTMARFDAGCNQIRVPLINGEIGPIASTRMACPPGSHEDLLLENLNNGPFTKLSENQFQIGEITFTRLR